MITSCLTISRNSTKMGRVGKENVHSKELPTIKPN